MKSSLQQNNIVLLLEKHTLRLQGNRLVDLVGQRG